MLNVKQFSVIIMMAFFTAFSAVGQDSSQETPAQDPFLLSPLDFLDIRGTGGSTGLDRRIRVMNYIDETITDGEAGKELVDALQHLSMEGIRNRTVERGQIINNFPSIRKEVAKQLGRIGTAEAKNILIQMVLSDTEPAVLTEAIKSLGDIGMNDDDDVVNAITHVAGRFDKLRPNNLIAFATVEAFDKINRKNGSITNSEALGLLLRISNGNYVSQVKDRAKKLLMDMLHGREG